MPSKLSDRGTRAQARPFSYFDAFVKTFSDTYRPGENENGYINLAVAQNVLSAELFHNRLCRAFAEHPSPVSATMYDDMKGSQALREAMARHIRRRVCRGDSRAVVVSGGDVVLSSGAGAVIENLVMCLCDEGDSILIPAPFYPAFPNDLRARLGVNTVPVHCDEGAANLPSHVEYDRVVQRDVDLAKCKAILLSYPGNPTGVVYSARQIRETIEWAVRRRLHVISDEIYACSVFNPNARHEFVSAILIVEYMIQQAVLDGEEAYAQDLKDNVHVIYGLSKDFCASGYRVGALWTRNGDIHRALDNASYFCAVPGPMQHALAVVLEDDEFVDAFFNSNRAQLYDQYSDFSSRLAPLAEDVVEPDAAMFVLFSLRNYLPESGATFEDEKRLWTHVYDVAKVVLTPGADCASREPGWFRVCFAAVDKPTLAVAIHRIINALKSFKM